MQRDQLLSKYNINLKKKIRQLLFGAAFIKNCEIEHAKNGRE